MYVGKVTVMAGPIRVYSFTDVGIGETPESSVKELTTQAVKVTLTVFVLVLL